MKQSNLALFVPHSFRRIASITLISFTFRFLDKGVGRGRKNLCELKSIQLRYLDNFYSFSATLAYLICFHQSGMMMLLLLTATKGPPPSFFDSSAATVERKSFSGNVLTQFSSVLFQFSSACLDDKLLIQFDEARANNFQSCRLKKDDTMRSDEKLAQRENKWFILKN